MDSFDTVKFDKATAMLRYNLLRLLELCAALLLLSWCSTRLPLALQFFRWISGFFAAHVFFFFLCNAIILSLLAHSGWLSDQIASDHGSAENAEANLYDELVKNRTDRSNSKSGIHDRTAEEEIVFHDKEIVAEVPVRAISKNVEDRDTDTGTNLDFPKAFRRTKSEIKYLAKSANNVCPVLRRSETQICREIVSDGDEHVYGEEEMSNEEFQKTIEAFIAKQLKFRRQESTAGVLQSYM